MGRLLFLPRDRELKKAYLGIELGSTRIKSVLIDQQYEVIASGSYTWESILIDGKWSYHLEDAEEGCRAALKSLTDALDEDISLQSVGISGMMHGYLAFDKDWKLLAPFRTWQNTTTREASELLIRELGFNIPQRWSIAHLLQAVLDGEEHVADVAHLTTLAGYIHHKLTGEDLICVDEASGMFPIDCEEKGFDRQMLDKTQDILRRYGFQGLLKDILPGVRVAGEQAGSVTDAGCAFLGGAIPQGVPAAPPTGDGGTGMVATNTVAPKTGNVSAGTSIFADIVLEHPLSRLYPEIDIVATPCGLPVAEIHGNNCTNDMNLWVKMFRDALALFGHEVSDDELFTRLYECSLEGEPDCGEVTVVNYTAGEAVVHLDEGRPLMIRTPGSRLDLQNFIRAHLYALFATLKIGIDIIKDEDIHIDWLMGHGGVFKTRGVGMRYLAAACGAAVSCMENASEGGPYGMALLCAYMSQRREGESLEAFLNERVFAGAKTITARPEKALADGFAAYMERFKACLKLEELAVKTGL